MRMGNTAGMTSLLNTTAFRWGLIGPGKIAAQFAGAIEVVEGSHLHAVAGRDRSRAETFSQGHGVPMCYDNHLELLSDPDIDAVYIAAPHRYHFELARDCLLAGKPVLCEKPLTVNARESLELIELSRRHGVFLMEALWTRFLPIYGEVNQWLVSGKIGEVTSITSSFGFPFPRNLDDRLLNPDLAGGALLDLGVYNLTMSQWVFGTQPVSHTIDGYLGETNVDEHGVATLFYSHGRCSKFEISMIKELDNDLIIHGSSGHIHVHPMFWSATRATLFQRGKSTGAHSSTSITREWRGTGLEYEIEAAQRCIRNGAIECSVISHADTLKTMQLMDSLRHDMGLSYEFEYPSSSQLVSEE
jgi:dihydrodiol dehydrogenase / D-xylose 1-dehydrogenase (NADP)